MSIVEQSMRQKLESEFQPQALEIRNVSHRHAGHASSPGTGESHFEVDLVSEAFSGMSRVARYRKIHALLAEEMAGPVHALSLNVRSPDEV
jgi:BolA protein